MFISIMINILKFLSFIIILSVFIVFLGLLLNKLFSKFKFNVKNIKIYSIFLNINNRMILALSCTIIKYIFILWSITFIKEYDLSYLFMLLLISLIYNICIRNFLGLIFDTINSAVEYFSFISFGLLIGYTLEVRIEWYVIVMSVVLFSFVFVYSTYFFLKNINDVIILSVDRK